MLPPLQPSTARPLGVGDVNASHTSDGVRVPVADAAAAPGEETARAAVDGFNAGGDASASAREELRAARAAFGGTTTSTSPAVRYFAARSGVHRDRTDRLGAPNDAIAWLKSATFADTAAHLHEARALFAAAGSQVHAYADIETFVDVAARGFPFVLEGLVAAAAVAGESCFPDTRAVRDQLVVHASRVRQLFTSHARVLCDGTFDPETFQWGSRPVVEDVRRAGTTEVRFLTTFGPAGLPYRLGAGVERVVLGDGTSLPMIRPYALVHPNVVRALAPDPGLLKLLQSMVTLSSHDLIGHGLNNNWQSAPFKSWSDDMESQRQDSSGAGFQPNLFEAFLSRSHRAAWSAAAASQPALRAALVHNAFAFVGRAERVSQQDEAKLAFEGLTADQLTTYLVTVYFKHLFFILPPDAPELAPLVAKYPYLSRNVRFQRDVHRTDEQQFNGKIGPFGRATSAFSETLARGRLEEARKHLANLVQASGRRPADPIAFRTDFLRYDLDKDGYAEGPRPLEETARAMLRAIAGNPLSGSALTTPALHRLLAAAHAVAHDELSRWPEDTAVGSAAERTAVMEQLRTNPFDPVEMPRAAAPSG